LISLPRMSSPKAIALLLITTILLAEYVLVTHAVEHSFAELDGACFVCEKANNFHNTLTGSIGLVQVPRNTGYEPQSQFTSRLRSFLSLFRSRAPPVSTPV
jgi:hypothetical protein